MIRTIDIPLVADTPYVFPDDYAGDIPIGAGMNTPYDETSISFADAGTVNAEFDYGLGYGAVFAQTDKNVAYKSTAVRRVRLESIGQANTAQLVFSKPVGGL